MKLTELFTSEKQMVDASGKGQVNSARNASIINRQIHSLAPGQTIQGELVARNGSEVQIKLADDMVIKARLEQSMNLEIGKIVTFEVKNNGQSLLLSPLYANMATDANVLKAIEMASLPLNHRTVEMTELLMKAGLSIDRNSLQQVFREGNSYANVEIADIVDLHKLSMPVNEGNLSQLASYKNLTHQLVTGLNNCLEVLPDTMQDMLKSGDIDGAKMLYGELVNMVQEGVSGEVQGEMYSGISGEIFSEISGEVSSEMKPALLQTADGQLLILLPPTKEQAQFYSFPGDGQLLQTLLQPEYSEILQKLAQGDSSQLLQALADGDEAAPAQTATQLLQSMGEALQNPTLSGEQPLLQTLLQGNNRQALQQLLQNQNGMLQLLAQAVKEAEHGETYPKTVGLSDFLKSGLQEQWTITPKEVGSQEQVEQLYNRLDKQLKGLTQVLEQVNQTGSEAYRATVNLTQNLDFLQQLNQAYTFVQLPLRLQQGNSAHGELYVYTNKKHLAARDGQISALLHLDMEHLGPVDVYVAMQNERVNTQFYVQDDEMLDFLAEHMDILTKRLEARGYSCDFKLQTRENAEEGKTSAIQQILQESGHVPMVQYAFDVRT